MTDSILSVAGTAMDRRYFFVIIIKMHNINHHNVKKKGVYDYFSEKIYTYVEKKL